MRPKLALAALIGLLVISVAGATNVSNLSTLANAITTQNNTTNMQRIKTYAQAQAAATQSQETDIQALLAHVADLEQRVAALENASPPPPPPAVACNDQADNDGDGKVDYPADPGCTSATDTDETDAPPPPPPPPGGFPDASNTGIPAGTTLTAYTGPSNITTPNTVIDGKTIGCIQVSAPGVVIKNSRISCAGGYALYVDDRGSYSASSNATVPLVTVQDSEIDCQDTPGSAGVGEADVKLVRVEITHCENGLDINQNIDVEDSFIHNLYNGGGSHADGAQMACGHWDPSFSGSSCAAGYAPGAYNVTLRHNTIFGMGDNDTTFGTSAIISNGNAMDKNILIDNNLLAGGAYTLYCEQNSTGVNYRVTNNHFTTRFKSTVGFYGPATDCADEQASGNVYDETGQPVPLN